jgi:hypothetical protein
VTTVEQEYRALTLGFLELYPALPALQLRESHEEITNVAHGWYMRCHRGVEAVLILEQAGLTEDAGPIRRCILEHNVALKWLAEQGAAVGTALRRGAAYDAGRRKKAIEAASWTSVDLELFDAIIEDGENLDRQHDTLLQFKARCDRFASPHEWVEYLNETARAHPSWASAEPYIDVTSVPARLLHTSAPVIDQAGFCAVHMMMALVDLNSMLADDAKFGPELDQLAAQLGNVVLRQRAEIGLPVPTENDGTTPT